MFCKKTIEKGISRKYHSVTHNFLSNCLIIKNYRDLSFQDNYSCCELHGSSSIGPVKHRLEMMFMFYTSKYFQNNIYFIVFLAFLQFSQMSNYFCFKIEREINILPFSSMPKLSFRPK